MGGHDDLLLRAKLAEQTERFDEMVGYMSALAKLGLELPQEERNLFSIGFKNFMAPKRNALKVVTAAVQQAENESSFMLPYYKKFRDEIQKEMRDLSHKMIGLIESVLVKQETPADAKVFYLKLKADYFRYLAEFEEGDDQKDVAEYSLKAYKEAYELAVSTLQPTHPIRLGIALNFSVFYYEIAHSADRACKLAKQAFDDAIAELDNISEESYKDSTLIMQLLRDNLTLWISDMQTGEKDPRE
ncbi:unnamed protein product [Calicophoron daubneyi]|uniref:14-3-3 domain-containing protein n=1 Tax=Calicophoron daubneyi TaxID=300641 RepID=A0AAV2TEQ9_CALDB